MKGAGSNVVQALARFAFLEDHAPREFALAFERPANNARKVVNLDSETPDLNRSEERKWNC